MPCAILVHQVETGTPYMLYKDACNFKSNQKNLGTIKSSNLCTEIVEYTAPDEVCDVVKFKSCLTLKTIRYVKLVSQKPNRIQQHTSSR